MAKSYPIMQPLYPLQFTPIFKRYLWGGRKLGTLLKKPIGSEDAYAESWELVDRADDQSRVLLGPLAGITLGELRETRGRELFGPHHPQSRFPLLFKFLDCNKTLSVQVHPNDDQAAGLHPPDFGKTEAWVVLAAEPGSSIYAGLKRGFDRHALEREVRRGTCELCLHRIEPRPGDCVFLPAGAVHALGAGLVIAEIQQSSDTTFRLFDWNRVGADGRPRPLHVEQALDAIDYDLGPLGVQKPCSTALAHVEQLAQCDKFVLERWTLDTPSSIGGDERFHFLALIEGELAIHCSTATVPLRLGQTVLLPASIEACQLNPNGRATLLDIYLP